MDLSTFKVFVEEQISTLTDLREQYQENDDYSMDDYACGAIDAYDAMRIRLEDSGA